MPAITGHHHISMLTKHAQDNNHFYRNILGLRRVKKTVNQDDPSMYHLFYGDLTGSAGTELSFFEMPRLAGTVRGTNAITRIGLLVRSIDSLHYWSERFEQFGVQHSGITRFAGREALLFEDGEGLRLALINHAGEAVPENWAPWDESSVDEEHRILGMGTVEFTVRSLEDTARTLRDMLGYVEASRTGDEAVYQSIAGEVFGEIVVKQEDGPNERPGKGSVHHLAIRVKDEPELRYWDAVIRQQGFRSTGVIDRYYFHSLYFREANGILIEMATDGPGFTADSSVEELGLKLDLPPFLEERRAEIEAKLIPLD